MILPARYRDLSLLLLILLCASALRFWNHDFDPLHEGRPRSGDALKKLTQSLGAARGEFVPKRFMQPFYLIHTTGALIKAVSPQDPEDMTFLWDVGVFSMVGYSLLTVLLVYWLARAVFDDRRVGLLSALFLAVVPLNVMGSRYFKEDIPLMFFMNLSVFLMILLMKRRGGIFYILSGVAIGLSIAVKYAAMNLIGLFLVAHLLTVRRAPRAERLRRLVSGYFLFGSLMIIAGFLAFNTHVISNWDNFWEGFRTQLAYAGRGHHDGTAISGWEHWWTFYIRYALLPGIGLPACLAAGAGMAIALRRKIEPAIFVAAWIALFYLGLEKSPAKPFPFFARYMHGLAPGLCMFAAFALCEAYRAWAGRGWKKWVAVSATVISVCVPLAKTCLINHSIGSGRETRDRARAWMATHLESGSKILVDSRSYAAEPASDRFDVRLNFHRNLDYIQNRDVDYIVLGSFSHDRFEYDKDRGEQAEQTYGYYLSVFNECELVQEFRPRFAFMTYGFHNPVIGIYRVER